MQMVPRGSPNRCDSPSTTGHHPNTDETTEDHDLSASSGSVEVVHGSNRTSTEGSWQLHESFHGYPSKQQDVSSIASSKVAAEHQLNNSPKTLFAVVCNPTVHVETEGDLTRRSISISPLSVDCFEPQLVCSSVARVTDFVEQTGAVAPDNRSQLYVSSEHITLEQSRSEALLQSPYAEAGSKFQLDSQKLRHTSGREIILQYPPEELLQDATISVDETQTESDQHTSGREIVLQWPPEELLMGDSPSRKLSVDEIRTESDQHISGRETVLQWPLEKPRQEYSPSRKLSVDEIRTESDQHTSGREIVLQWPLEEPQQEYSPSRKLSVDEIQTGSDEHTSGREIVLQWPPEELLMGDSPSRKLSVDEIRTGSDQHTRGTEIVLQWPPEERIQSGHPSRKLSVDDHPTETEELGCTSCRQDPDAQVFVINC